MSANIVLKRADFSANNIGRVVEYDPMTLAILAKQTQYAQGSDEADALNTFVVGMKEAGLLFVDNAPIKTLCIPALAASHDELAYNIALFDNGYPKNSMPTPEVEAETKTWEAFENNGRKIGVRLLYNATSATFIARTKVDNNLGLPSSGACPDITQFVFNLADYSGSSNSLRLSEIGDPTYAYPFKMYTKGFGTNISGTAHWCTPASGSSFKGFNAVSLHGLTFEPYADNATFTEANLPMDNALTVPGAGRDKLFLGQNNSGLYPKLALFGCATYLSSTQMATLRSLVSTLMTALRVTDYIA